MLWWECGDIRVYSDQGEVLYSGPKFVRCEEYGCRAIVTDGQLKAHGACECGMRRFRPALKLTDDEKRKFLSHSYILSEWEEKMIFGEDIRWLPDAPSRRGNVDGQDAASA